MQWGFRRIVMFGWLALAVATVFELATRASGESAVKNTESVQLNPIVVSGLDHPLFLTHAGDGSGRLFVVEQPGGIRIVERGALVTVPFLDIADRVRFGGEQGLLGLAFHPDYRRNGRFFVNYNRRSDGATVLAEYRRGTASVASRDERIVMIVPQPFANHNGGMLAFGPDGYLYVGRGDGGSRGDPDNRAQNPDDLLGKILRIDIDRGTPYAIPADNPFAKGGGRPEIFALGLRNPWRFSFDAQTGALWVADVGQYKWEEIDLVTRGGNYGWRRMEGTHCYDPAVDCASPQLLPPLMEYTHEKGRCSITGGYVYRGKAVPHLAGMYLYGDFCSGEIFAYQGAMSQGLLGQPTVLFNTSFRISSFGVDEQQEVYVTDHSGGLYRLDGRAVHNLPTSQ
jgi:glucose/arabinose dehydrogenase